MVENRPWLTFFTHFVPDRGGDLPVLPGLDGASWPRPTRPRRWPAARSRCGSGRGVGELHHAPDRGRRGRRRRAGLARMMLNSLIMALGITIGKIAISLLSAYAIVYFRFPFRMFFFWMIFITLMLPVEVRILPTYDVIARLGLLNSYMGLIDPADRLGHGDLPVPAVLPDDPRRADGGRAHRPGGADALLLRHPAAAVAAPISRRSSSSSSSMAGTSISGRS
jgi:hypothetical protein